MITVKTLNEEKKIKMCLKSCDLVLVNKSLKEKLGAWIRALE